jgi:hypothetical protein
VKPSSDVLEAPPTTPAAPAPAEAAAPPAEAPAAPQDRYQSKLTELMAKAREAREKQVSTRQQEEELAFLQKIKIAKELGPDAALKALGVERQKIDIDKLLNPRKDDEPESVKELKAKVEQINQYIETVKQQQEEYQKQAQQQQYVQMEQRELGGISQFIDEAKDKFEYVAAAKAIGSDKDIYNGLVSMYNQGYSPSYDEMAELVETRIEQLIDLLAPTKKFSDYVSKKYGAPKATQGTASATLTSSMTAEVPEAVDLNKMTDEENLRYSLKAAYAAKQEALRKLGATK